ncbi:MAG: xanthine dehydrogenase family protein subunit M [bacterium]|nr:xanthine dehydrogenase family protein subunit M [bacterium]
MAVAHDFEYVKAATLQEALALLAAPDRQSCVLAGGTDLALKLKEGAERPDVVIDIKGLQELQEISLKQNGMHIGALASFSALMKSELIRRHLPLLSDASSTVGSVGIRNRATICGNICSAVPSLDSGPALLVHEAVALLKSVEGEKRIPIAEWFIGPKRAALKPDELLIGLEVPVPSQASGGCYVKLGRYSGEDLAQAGVGVLALEGHEYRIAFCAVGPVPKRAWKIEALLNGKVLSADLLEEAKALVPEEISPITDIRASKEYRLLMIQVMLERGLKAALAKLRGENSKHGAMWV